MPLGKIFTYYALHADVKISLLECSIRVFERYENIGGLMILSMHLSAFLNVLLERIELFNTTMYLICANCSIRVSI